MNWRKALIALAIVVAVFFVVGMIASINRTGSAEPVTPAGTLTPTAASTASIAPVP